MEICISGIKVTTIIGCYSHERDTKQDLIFNLKLDIDNNQHIKATDALENTVNYDAVINFVRAHIEKSSYYLLEKLALEINELILAEYKIITSVQIEIIKLALGGVLANEIKVRQQTFRQYRVALAFGSNADNLPKQQIITAIEILSQYLNDIKISKFYKTKPYGFLEQNDFYNAVIVAATSLKPGILLAKIKKLEKMLGKNEVCLNGPRNIDIDIIFYDQLILSEKFLLIPHPAMHLRDFVLKPLMDIDPQLIHPQFNKSVADLYKELGKEDLTIIASEEYAAKTY